MSKIFWKTVRNDSLWRRVYYNSETKIQIAIAVSILTERDPDEPWEWEKIRVYLSHENSGRYVDCNTVTEAEQFISRQLNWLTRIYDNLFLVTYEKPY
jgi:hypothetical protein